MRKIAYLLSVITLFAACDDGNLIKDPALRGCVQSWFDYWEKDYGKRDVNSVEDLKIIELTFACESKGVKSLEGIEYLVNATDLRLGNNEIEDLSPLKDHKKLTGLNVIHNKIRNIEVLPTIENLYSVDIPVNYVSDLTPLMNVKKLHYLTVNDNCISDVSQCEQIATAHPDMSSILGCATTDQHPEKCQ